MLSRIEDAKRTAAAHDVALKQAWLFTKSSTSLHGSGWIEQLQWSQLLFLARSFLSRGKRAVQGLNKYSHGRDALWRPCWRRGLG